MCILQSLGYATIGSRHPLCSYPLPPPPFYPIPYILYPYPPQKGGARIFYVDSAAAVLKLAKIFTRFFRRFHFQPFFLMRIYT